MKVKMYVVRWSEVVQHDERYEAEHEALTRAATVARNNYGGATIHTPDGTIMLLRDRDKT